MELAELAMLLHNLHYVVAFNEGTKEPLSVVKFPYANPVTSYYVLLNHPKTIYLNNHVPWLLPGL